MDEIRIHKEIEGSGNGLVVSILVGYHEWWWGGDIFMSSLFLMFQSILNILGFFIGGKQSIFTEGG